MPSALDYKDFELSKAKLELNEANKLLSEFRNKLDVSENTIIKLSDKTQIFNDTILFYILLSRDSPYCVYSLPKKKLPGRPFSKPIGFVLTVLKNSTAWL